MTVSEIPGWCGKLPAEGDFLQQRLAAAPIASWSNWFQQGLLLRQRDAAADNAAFERAPTWNFALPATLGVQRIQIGCLRPSRDRVGRIWPLLALQSVPVQHWHPSQLMVADGWYQALGATLHQAVTQRLTALQLEHQLQRLPALAPPESPRDAESAGERPLWPEAASRFDPLQYTSYWWTSQCEGQPLIGHQHSGNLTAKLFSQLFQPAAPARPGRQGLYPPMFD